MYKEKVREKREARKYTGRDVEKGQRRRQRQKSQSQKSTNPFSVVIELVNPITRFLTHIDTLIELRDI